MKQTMERALLFIFIVSILSGCAGSPSSVSNTATATPQPTATATATSATATPVPGALWEATAPHLGTFDFTTDAAHTTIQDMLLHINTMCGPGSVSLNPVDAQGTWPITQNHFSFNVGPANTVLALKLTGTFDAAFQHVAGTWVLSYIGSTCKGTWTGQPAG
jgi:hypothetical protein